MISEQFSTITPDLRELLCRTVTSFLDLLWRQIDATNLTLVARGERAQPMPDHDLTQRCVLAVANHLDWHIRVYGVDQREIDFFKVAAWLGMQMFHASGQTFSPRDLVTVLNTILINDGKSLPDGLCKKIACMLVNDKSRDRLKGNNGEELAYDDLAIGMNGLYMIFRASSEAQPVTCEAMAA